MSITEEVVIALERKARFIVEHADKRQIVPPPDLEIVEVMRRRDLHGAGAFFRVGVLIRYDRNTAADQRQDDEIADQAFEPLVMRMHRDRGVAEHSFRPRGGDDDELIAAL